MIRRIKRVLIVTVAFVGAASVVPLQAGDWSETVAVLHEHLPCVSYRARLDGEFLVVQAKIEPGWHTFVMDNKQRSLEKLAGRQSLGVDGPTEISLNNGLEVTAPWYQSTPKDFSKPELRWYSWGYEHQAQFVAKVKQTGSGPAQIDIRGQACTETTCKNIDATILLPLTKASRASTTVDLKTLVPVRATD